MLRCGLALDVGRMSSAQGVRSAVLPELNAKARRNVPGFFVHDSSMLSITGRVKLWVLEGCQVIEAMGDKSCRGELSACQYFKGPDRLCAALLWGECAGALQADFTVAAQLQPFERGDGGEAASSEDVGLSGGAGSARAHISILAVGAEAFYSRRPVMPGLKSVPISEAKATASTSRGIRPASRR
jgi:hypothetical protein